MDGVLRNMASVFILNGDKILMLYRQGGKVVNNVWIASAGGHFEKDEINDARACVVREMKEEKENIDTNFCSNEGRLEWVNKEAVRELEMPFMVKYVIKHYLEIGSSSDVLYAGVANGKGLIFTGMPEC